MEDKKRKLSFDEMTDYTEKLGCNFFNAMIGEVVNVAIIEEQQLSIEEIQDIANKICDSDELSEVINGIIFDML